MEQRDPGKILIVGGGPTGLGAAWRLQESGYDDYLLVEACGSPGGLAASVVDPCGFTWDLGGHVQFSHYSYYDRVLDEVVESWLWHERESWVWFKERFVPYPFQYNVHRLDAQDRERVCAGLREAQSRIDRAPRPRNFREWIMNGFGPGLADLFMLPYNFKVWGYPLDRMAWNWIGERVAMPDLARIEANIAHERDDVSWGPNNRFRFPLKGGTGSIWRGVAKRIRPERVRYGFRVRGVEARTRTIVSDSGERLSYDALISTIPLDNLLGVTDGLPAPVRQMASRFRHSSTHILGIGLIGGKPESLAGKCWMYFPEAHSPYYRVTVFSHYSPFNVPPGEGVWSLMAEVCETPHRPVDIADVKDWTLRALRADGLIDDRAQIVSVWHRRLEHGYPTPFLGRDETLTAVTSALEAKSIYSRGRFGGWKYEASNQDHSFMQGVETVNRLLRGEPETTYPYPARANSGVFQSCDEDSGRGTPSGARDPETSGLSRSMEGRLTGKTAFE